ncbi:hypothetical protein Hamer_G009211 [Homarus americanus]|uniref:Uncharacterized protein n=1 Tax=Homarus americanus TaxID=6706 RepID=A0A8J5TQ11_HOMAM|nr:hypothetical protein Hamer_G009211 [Homarus americanus]
MCAPERMGISLIRTRQCATNSTSVMLGMVIWSLVLKVWCLA